MSGGVKQIFRQAETLKKNGFNASVLLQGKSKQKWFHSDAQISHSPYLFKLLKYILGNRKITFIKKNKTMVFKQEKYSYRQEYYISFS